MSVAVSFHGLSESGRDEGRREVVSPLWNTPEDGGVVGNGEGCQAEYVISVSGGSGCVVSYNLMSRGDSKEGRGRDVVGRSKLLESDSKRNKGRDCLEFLRAAPQG